jgi:hypothetical protein
MRSHLVSAPRASADILAAASGWRQHLWLALLVIASIAFSRGFACVTPLAAFAAAASLTLRGRDAALLVAAVWLANQIVGYAFLAYPLTVDSVAWGIALGAASLLATFAAGLVARATAGAGQAMRLPAAFLASFVVYEAALLAVAATLLGGVEKFAPTIVDQIFAVDAAAFVGLVVLHRVAMAIGLASPAVGALRA